MYDETRGKADCYANHLHINLFSCLRYHQDIVNTEPDFDCIGQKKNVPMQNIFHYYLFFLKILVPHIQWPRHLKILNQHGCLPEFQKVFRDSNFQVIFPYWKELSGVDHLVQQYLSALW